PTGWRLLASGTNGNLRRFGRHMRSGAASANNTPTVTFTGGAANATTLAQISAWRGTDQDISTVRTASAGSNFIAAQNLPRTARGAPSPARPPPTSASAPAGSRTTGRASPPTAGSPTSAPSPPPPATTPP